MADPLDWDAAHGPGDNYFTYTNMNFPIVASVIERVTGERFDIWMRAQVLEPMKLDACYNWPTCSDAADRPRGRARRARRQAAEGRSARRAARPARSSSRTATPATSPRWKPGENGALFAPQGGLRISARGLARVGRMLLNGGTLDGVRILSPQSVETMLTPGLALRRPQRRRATARALLSAATAWRRSRFPTTGPAAPTTRARNGAIARRPCRRRLRPALRPVDRPRARRRHRLFRHRRARGPARSAAPSPPPKPPPSAAPTRCSTL